MTDFVFTSDIILLLLPVILLQLGLAAYCAVRIYREGVQNLNRWAWLLICLFIQLIGPLCFLIIGRRKEYR